MSDFDRLTDYLTAFGFACVLVTFFVFLVFLKDLST